MADAACASGHPMSALPSPRASVTGTTATTRSCRSLPLTSLNHVSIHCANVEESLQFYCKVMGFIPIRRPECLNFDGAWLFNYGVGIHLLYAEDPSMMGSRPQEINPKSDHMSFQCEDIGSVESVLQEHGVPFLRQAVEEHGLMVQQLFFHDPDGHMIEICNCNVLPVVPVPAEHARPACFRNRRAGGNAPAACGPCSTVPCASDGAPGSGNSGIASGSCPMNEDSLRVPDCRASNSGDSGPCHPLACPVSHPVRLCEERNCSGGYCLSKPEASSEVSTAGASDASRSYSSTQPQELQLHASKQPRRSTSLDGDVGASPGSGIDHWAWASSQAGSALHHNGLVTRAESS